MEPEEESLDASPETAPFGTGDLHPTGVVSGSSGQGEEGQTDGSRTAAAGLGALSSDSSQVSSGVHRPVPVHVFGSAHGQAASSESARRDSDERDVEFESPPEQATHQCPWRADRLAIDRSQAGRIEDREL
eukprot:SAG31_NODE_17518_length_667_cov_4.286972_1_plen_131_part_00